MRCRLGAASLAVAAAVAAGAAGPAGWTPADPAYVWSFPRDHWAHPGFRNEWWYLTGELESVADPGRRFGYQFTLFRIGLLPRRPELDSTWAARGLVLGHAAVSDLATGEHRFSEVLYRATPILGGFAVFPENPLAWTLAPPGTDAPWSLAWNDGFAITMRDDGRRFGFELAARPTNPVVLQGPNGYSRKSRRAGYASQYYSLTRLATEGVLTIDGAEYRVRGTSWMDKEFGSSQLAPGQVGWDWFGLRLDDGRDLMLYLLRRADGAVDYRSATLVAADGTPAYLGPEAWAVGSTATWTSPETEATYPARWTVALPQAGLRLVVVPEIPDQENVGTRAGGPYYWEGAVRVLDDAGRPVGRGYVELTGYGADNRPPL